VVGGGPAGIAAAIAVRRRGLWVMTADLGEPPIDKACGEGLMPDAVEALGDLGISVDPARSAPFRGIRFLDPAGSVAATFPGRSGIGVPRTTLHAWLTKQAGRLGVPMLWRTRALALSNDGVVLEDARVRCRWVIGADGVNSRVRRWAGLQGSGHPDGRFGLRRRYRVRPWTDHVEIYWGSRGQIYVTPVEPEEISLALITRDADARLETALAEFPTLLEHLAGAAAAAPDRGAPAGAHTLNRVARGRVALVGDASGAVDAITGQGLSLAFRHALALAEALETGSLPSYEAEHRRLRAGPSLMGRLLLTLEGPRMRRRVLSALKRRPATFARLLALHVGALSRPRFLLRGTFPLAWGILTG